MHRARYRFFRSEGRAAQAKRARAGRCKRSACSRSCRRRSSTARSWIKAPSPTRFVSCGAGSSCKTKDVAIAIAGHSVIIKKITVPMMKPDELAANIRNEAEHHIPFGRDDVEIDYHVTNPMTRERSDRAVARRREEGSRLRLRAGRARRRPDPAGRRRRRVREPERLRGELPARSARDGRARSTSAPRSRTSTSCAAACRCSRAT